MQLSCFSGVRNRARCQFHDYEPRGDELGDGTVRGLPPTRQRRPDACFFLFVLVLNRMGGSEKNRLVLRSVVG